MPEQLYKPVPGASALVDPARIIPALPSGIPILPANAKTRVPRGLIVLLVVVGLAGLTGLQIWTNHHRRVAVDAAGAKPVATQSQAGTRRTRSEAGAKRSAADNAKIAEAVGLAMWTYRPKGTRIPVKLSYGVRLFQIDSSVVYHQAGKPTTCVRLSVIEPRTGARDAPETLCLPSLNYPIQ